MTHVKFTLMELVNDKNSSNNSSASPMKNLELNRSPEFVGGGWEGGGGCVIILGGLEGGQS